MKDQQIPKVSRLSIRKAVESLLEIQAHKAIVYQHPKLTIVATRRDKPAWRSDRHIEIVLTIGRPNFVARRHIKQLLKAGEPFPVKRVDLKFWPKTKKERK